MFKKKVIHYREYKEMKGKNGRNIKGDYTVIGIL